MTDATRPGAMPLALLRGVALFAVVAGAALSLALMLRAGHPPLFLRVLFTGWVLSPFVALVFAHIASQRWRVPARATLYGLTLVIALGSPALYGGIVPMPPGSRPAAVFLVVPFGSWLLLTIAALVAAWKSRKRARGAAGT